MSNDQRNSMDRHAFRNALGSFATGVTIVSTQGADGHDVGITANSFNSVSLDPPMVLWSLSRKAHSLPAFAHNEFFAVHVLAADQDELSRRFATQGADKFANLAVRRGIGNLPLLDGCSARFQCRKAFTYDGGDHLILVGEVMEFDSFPQPPLLFHAGRYALAVQKNADRLPGDIWSSELDSSFSRDFLAYLLGRARYQLFHSLRAELERHALTEEEWFILSLLGAADDRSIAELDRLLWLTGYRVTYECVARLASLGLVELRGGHDPSARVRLSDRGRSIVIELVAAAKAAESHAERNLGPGETQFLKDILRKLIHDTYPGSPPLTRIEDD